MYGNSSQKLTREEAGDLSQAIYWAGVTATASKASSATVAGIKVVAKGRTVEFVGFGRPISKKSADVLIAKLHDVYRGVFRG